LCSSRTCRDSPTALSCRFRSDPTSTKTALLLREPLHATIWLSHYTSFRDRSTKVFSQVVHYIHINFPKKETRCLPSMPWKMRGSGHRIPWKPSEDSGFKTRSVRIVSQSQEGFFIGPTTTGGTVQTGPPPFSWKEIKTGLPMSIFERIAPYRSFYRTSVLLGGRTASSAKSCCARVRRRSGWHESETFRSCRRGSV
jgi:hypothetical protein